MVSLLGAAQSPARSNPALRTTFLFLLGLLVLIPFLFPFVWMLLGSFKEEVDFMAYPPVWIFKPTLENYRNVFVENDFGTFAINSTIVAALTTFFGLLFGIPGAYAVARYKRTGFALIVLAARMAPGIAFLLPWFVLFVQLRLTNTYFALVTTHLIFTLAGPLDDDRVHRSHPAGDRASRHGGWMHRLGVSSPGGDPADCAGDCSLRDPLFHLLLE